jgi:hypothetical protein
VKGVELLETVLENAADLTPGTNGVCECECVSSFNALHYNSESHIRTLTHTHDPRTHRKQSLLARYSSALHGIVRVADTRGAADGRYQQTGRVQGVSEGTSVCV